VKNLNHRQLHVICYALALLPMAIMLVIYKSELLNHTKENIFYFAYLGLIIIIDIWRIATKKELQTQFLLEFIYAALIGGVTIYYIQGGELPFHKIFLLVASLVFIRKGNRQSIIQQDSPQAGIMKDYDKTIYQKSQRMLGRSQFALGVFGLLLALLVPDTFSFHAFAIFMAFNFVGAMVWLYKSFKAAS
jgi:hypothetical protein